MKKSNMVIGAQLFTLHDFTKTLDGLASCLDRVAEIGYRTVQVSGTCDYEPQWLADQLHRTGLRCVLTHTNADRIATNPDGVIAAHNVFACDNIGLGYFPFDTASPAEFEAKFGGSIRAIAASDKQFCYHNHDMELRQIDGEPILALLARQYTPRELCVTMDTYWVQAGGGDPAQWLRKLAGRVPCVHLKDMGYGRKMLPVGEGNMNFSLILNAAEDAGTRYLLVEQDDCNGEDPFDCLRRSYQYLTAQGLR